MLGCCLMEYGICLQPIKKQYMELFLQIHQERRLCSFNKQAAPSPRLATTRHPTAECPTCPLHTVNAESFTWHQRPHFEFATCGRLITLVLPSCRARSILCSPNWFLFLRSKCYLSFFYIIYINFSLYIISNIVSIL